MTPLDCALQRGFRSTAKFLQLHGGVPASRLSSVRVGSDQTVAASNIHIRDDITAKGSTSSESDLEDVHKKEPKPRRRAVRRRPAQRHDKKRGQSGSGSDADEDTHARMKRDESNASVKNIDDKTNDREKIAGKHDKEHDTKVKASHDVDVLREDGDGRTVKQIELKSDGKRFRKKRQETGSVSETDPSSSGSQVESNGKFTKAPNDKSIQCKPKTRSAASQKENYLDAERQKQNHEQNGKTISEPEAKVSMQKHESTLENGDIPSKKYSTEESDKQQKKTSTEKEDGDDLGNKEMEQDLEKDKQAEVQNDTEEKDVVEKQESQINDTLVDENPEESKKISNENLKKKKSLDAERKSIKSLESEKGPVDKVVKLLSVNSEEGRKRLKKQQSMHEPAEDDVDLMEHSSNGERLKKRSSKSDSAGSTKRKEKSVISAKSRKDSAKSTIDKTETEQATAEGIADNVEEPVNQQDNKQMVQGDTENVEGIETGKQVDEELEIPKKAFQPDQISLQSKMSEESPAKTIVVEAAVHPPPKGAKGENVPGEPSEQPSEEPEHATEVSPSLEESKQEVETQLAEEDKAEEVVDQGKEATVDKGADDEIAENEDEKKDKDDEELSEEEKVTTEETKTQPTVISVDDSTTATEIKSQEAMPLNGDSLAVDENKDVTTDGEPGVAIEAKNEEVGKPSTETKLENGEGTKESLDKSADELEDKEIVKENGAMQEEQVKELGNRAETLDKTEELPEDSEEMNKEAPEIDDIPAIEQSKKNDTKSKPTELNIDLSLKKFEETAHLQDGVVTDAEEKDGKETVQDSGKTVEEAKQKKYRKKKSSKSKIEKAEDTPTSEDAKTQQTIISELPADIKHAEKDQPSSSTSRESSSSETDSEKSVRKLKSQEDKKGEHKSFKVLKDVAFEVLKDATNGKEQRRTKRKSSKKSAKEVERPNESATSSPEMLESSRTRSRSLTREPRSSLDTHGITLPVLAESKLRSESNLSAPNLSSVYSDNEQKSASNSEVDDIVSSASRKRRFKKRAKMRIGSKSAGSDYESSNLIDSGFEPSPRSSRIPKRKVMSERGVNMISVTQNIQSNIRRYVVRSL